MPDRESVGGPGTGSGGFLPLQFPSAFAAFHASTPPGAATTAMHHATHYHHHAQGIVLEIDKSNKRPGGAIKGV
ncbi:hypothetical protein KGM_216197 [Danaus plexippus plexippus]|uniref:Uncharacterized protein n=1 Tax=Danaus plexippus plexippus TaxID=278856 RepID=A0A212EPW0_DANPL|nr:hypothetical protein KGM_216197 [Danaus plexippus plexippus]